jgi:hypothetical protein
MPAIFRPKLLHSEDKSTPRLNARRLRLNCKEFSTFVSPNKTTRPYWAEEVDGFRKLSLNLATRRRSRGRRANLRRKLNAVEIITSSVSSRNRIRASINSRRKYRVEM